jgi:hypothetical protein
MRFLLDIMPLLPHVSQRRASTRTAEVVRARSPPTIRSRAMKTGQVERMNLHELVNAYRDAAKQHGGSKWLR